MYTCESVVKKILTNLLKYAAIILRVFLLLTNTIASTVLTGLPLMCVCLFAKSVTRELET